MESKPHYSYRIHVIHRQASPAGYSSSSGKNPFVNSEVEVFERGGNGHVRTRTKRGREDL